MVLEKTLESPLDCKEIQPAHPKGDQSRVFIGRTDDEAETLVLWPPHAKSWLIGKDSDAGRDWGQEEKVMKEDEMAGWHHGLDGHESEWTPGVGDGQEGLACCDSWGRKELDMTDWLNWTSVKSWLIWKDPHACKDWVQGDDRGWDGWMASPTQWTWAWVNSGSWWWTGRSDILQFRGLQIVRHDWASELTDWFISDPRSSSLIKGSSDTLA